MTNDCIRSGCLLQQQLLPVARAVLVAAASLLYSACATITFDEYQTVVLDEDFESAAIRVDVRAPVARYRESFYNINMGAYQAENVSIGKTETVRSDRREGPERTVTENDTLWNLILDRELTAETVTYNQYRLDDRYTFSFSIVDQSGRQVDSQCSGLSIFLENEETARIAIGLGDISDENAVERYGEWLASKLSCTIVGEGSEWTLVSTTAKESAPAILLNRQGVTLTTRVLDRSIATEPGAGGRVPADDFGVTIGDSIAGLYIGQADEQLAAVSLARGNTSIWLGSATDAIERVMIMAAGYSLMLDDWL